MTSIQNLPEEILHLIFDQLQRDDLQQCQKVCRTWYQQAHVKFLEEIKLVSNSAIEQFMASIDHNPHPSYIKAVKRIDLEFISKQQYYSLDVERLFLRFYNLEIVLLVGDDSLLQSFSEEVCLAFLESCPKLEIFEVYIEEKGVDYFNLLYNVRSLLTAVDLEGVNYEHSFKGLTFVEYITHFSRLRAVHGYYGGELNKFRKHLTVLEKLPDIESITLGPVQGDSDFAEDYLDLKSAKERNLLLTRLAKVKYLEVLGIDMYSKSMKFASKYLTGLEKIMISTTRCYLWSKLEEQVFLENVLEMARRANSSILNLQQMSLPCLLSIFPTINQKLFHQQLSNNKATTTLTIDLANKRFSDSSFNDKVSLTVARSQFTHEIMISTCCKDNLNNMILDLLVRNTIFKNVDGFILHVDREYADAELDMVTYLKIFQNSTWRLKEVLLDIPVMREDLTILEPLLNASGNIHSHSQVEQLRLYATPDGRFNSLLHYFSFIFPNLKHLEFFYFSGIWDGLIGEYQVALARFTLETLVIDITPAKRKMQELNGCKFMVIEVETLSTFERQVYKLQLDTLSPTISRINQDDLRGYTLGTDFIRLNIIITKLQSLEVLFSNQDDLFESRLKYCVRNATCISVFNDNL